jgi:serine protease AprX
MTLHRYATRSHQAILGGLAAFVLLGLTGVTPVQAASGGSRSAIIVEAASTEAAARAVYAVGGTVDLSLPLVDGVAAHVDADGMSALGSNSRVRVFPDLVSRPTSATFGAGAIDTQVTAIDPGSDYTPDAGRGIAVALVDTGVADTPDLGGSRLLRGPDLSGEGDGVDRYGHGTFMAGLIAGDGTASADNSVRHTGIAPGATIVSVKVAGADGSASISRVIAGIGWVVTHRDEYHIRVLNLSFGVDAPMPYIANPLSAAVEATWASGITVVAAAGNEGSVGVTSPGDDPYVITAGATDTAQTRQTSDDTVPSWSSVESFPRYAKPDVVAPGVSVVSLRAPGSTIDVTYPEGRVDTSYFRGTGTSMSSAIVAGTAAVLISHHLGATPDDVKGALIDGAAVISGGARAIDLAAAEHATARPSWWQHFPVAMGGLGAWAHHGMPWNASRWTGDSWDASPWTASRWRASSWTDAGWTASRWRAQAWASYSWS